MQRDTIFLRVKDLLNSYFFSTPYTIDMHDKLLTGPDMGLDAISMYELLLCVEKEFKISFSFEEVQRMGVHSVQELVNLIEVKLSE